MILTILHQMYLPTQVKTGEAVLGARWSLECTFRFFLWNRIACICFPWRILMVGKLYVQPPPCTLLHSSSIETLQLVFICVMLLQTNIRRLNT